MGKRGKLLLDIGAHHNNAGSPGQIIPDIPTNQYNQEIEKFSPTPAARRAVQSSYVRSSYLLPLPQESLAAFRFFGSERESDLTNPGESIDLERFEQSKGAELQLNLPLGWLVGGTFIEDRLENRDETTPTSSYSGSLQNWGLFVQDTFQWKALSLIPGLRFDHHSTGGDSTNPRVQVITEVTPWLRVSGDAARSERAPTLDNLHATFTDVGGGVSYQGDPTLRSEKAWSYNAGFEIHEDSTSARLTYYHSNISDLLQTTPGPVSTTVNVRDARRQGVEMEFTHPLGDRLRHSLNYTYLDHRGQPAGFADDVALSLSPRHTAHESLRWTPTKRLTIDNRLDYVAESFEGNNESGDKLGDRLLWNMRFAYQLRQLDIFVGVDNITGTHYHERSGYPQPPQTFYSGVSLRLWG